MEEQRNMIMLLDQISQTGFLVQKGRILRVNQAAGAMLLSPGDDFLSLIHSGSEDYEAFADGQLCVTLNIAGRTHNALITRIEDADLVLLDADDIQEEFRSMALVSMELRKPLMQAISGARQLPADPKLNQSLMQMLRQVSNMADISRYTASARVETRDVDALLLEIFEKAQTLTEGRAELRYEGLGRPMLCLVDPEQLERAVLNILSNALKFLPQNGRIRATLRLQGSRLRLTVEDSGSGIAESVRSDLFRRYLRQPGIEDSRYGLGLGMALIRTVAANHGGTVLISAGKEGGTSVTMTLAVRTDDSSILRSPLFRPDYTGGWDHALVELSDCLSAAYYSEL